MRRVKFPDRRIVSVLYSLLTPSNIFIHHQFVIYIKSNPKFHVKKIKRFRRDTGDYWRHVNAFVQYYVKHSYSRLQLKEIAGSVPRISNDCESLRHFFNNRNKICDQIRSRIKWYENVIGLV